MANRNEIEAQASWRTKILVMGAALGSIVGLLASYLYARAAAEGALIDGTQRPRQIKTGELLSLGLAALAIIRQITELGREK